MKVILSALVLLLSVSCFGQDSDQKVKIVTKDGTVLTGTILLSDADNVTIQTTYGENVIDRDDIVSLDYTDTKTDGSNDYDSDDMDRYSGSHYLFGQSSYGVKKGQAYYENTYLFLNSFTYGVTDNFSIGAGFEVASILFGEQFPLTFITPKFSIPFNKGAFSLGTPLAFVPDGNGGVDAGGLLSAAVTFGSLRDNFTLGVGMAYTFESGFEDSFLPISFSGMRRITDRISLVSENLFITDFEDAFGVITAGVRIHGRTTGNFLTLSLIRPTEDIGILAYPFFSGTVRIK